MALGLGSDHAGFSCYNGDCKKTDRKASDGSSCFNDGVMGFAETPTKWSKCSEEDFRSSLLTSGGYCLAAQCVNNPTEGGSVDYNPPDSCQDEWDLSFCFETLRRNFNCNSENALKRCKRTCKRCGKRAQVNFKSIL